MKAQKVNSSMNILLWVLQVLLALWTLTGATYMMSNYRDIANTWALDTLPPFFWTILGLFEIVCAIGLVVPRTRKFFPKLRSISAIGLAIVTLLGIVLYSAYVGTGMLWAIIPAAIALGVAYKRWQ